MQTTALVLPPPLLPGPQVLYDIGAVSTPEPFHRLVSQVRLAGGAASVLHPTFSNSTSNSQSNLVHFLSIANKFTIESLQGMILGEVEFTVHKDASGAYCAEGTPGATTIRCVVFWVAELRVCCRSGGGLLSCYVGLGGALNGTCRHAWHARLHHTAAQGASGGAPALASPHHACLLLPVPQAGCV